MMIRKDTLRKFLGIFTMSLYQNADEEKLMKAFNEIVGKLESVTINSEKEFDNWNYEVYMEIQ
jgi:hypothetical protein